MLRKVIKLIVHSSKFIAKKLFLCFLSAGFLVISYPHFNLWLFAWVGFVPLFFAIRNKSKVKAFLLSYLTGVIFWWGIIYWLVHVTFIGTFVLILYLALYFGIFGLIFSAMSYQLSAISLLFIPSSWVILEYVRSHLLTGFPWALLGYSQYLNLPIIQIADITGAWGVSFLVMMVNVTVYQVIGHRLWVVGGKNKKITLFPSLLLIIVLCYGYSQLYLIPNTYHLTPKNSIKISVIQANIPQELKWDPRARGYIMDKYFTLTLRAREDSPALIIWPEAAVPVVLEEEPQFYERVKDFAKEIKIPLLFGAVNDRGDFYYNSALLLSSSGELQQKYNKLHLVPFGEYIPLKKALPFLETIVPIGDITRGKEYVVFELTKVTKSPSHQVTKPARFSVLICFEDLFPELSREFVKKQAGFLVNITNDAWYKDTSAAEQHFQASVFRAVENRVTVVRCANTGISGFISPNGEIVALVQNNSGKNTFISGYNTQDIILKTTALTFYTRYGEIFIFILFIFGAYAIYRLFFTNKARK